MIMSEEHEAMMGDDISLIGVTGEDHLPTNRLFVGSNGDLLPCFTCYQFARLASYLTWPKHKSNGPSFQALLCEALTQVVRKLANGSTGFIGISVMVETYPGILAQRWRIWHHQTRIFTTGHLINPTT